MDSRKMINRILNSTVGLLLVLLTGGALFAAEPNQITLNAERISYDEEMGVASAEGKVKVTNQDLTLLSPYLEYDEAYKQISAYSSPDGPVILEAGGRKLTGEKLDFNVVTRRGMLTHPNGKVEHFHLKGDSVEVMPLSDMGASRKGATEDEENELGGKWHRAVVTTCNKPHPHYRLESREVIVIPGRRVIVRNPRVYVGDMLILAYPFDYIAPLTEGQRRYGVFPKLGYESGKGVGIGITGPYVWDGGGLSFEAIYWSDGIWEGGVRAEHEVQPGLYVLANMMRKYDKDRETTLYRPSWGVEREQNGWIANALWSQRELMRVEKSAGRERSYVVWRDPEVNVVSPWYNDPAVGGKFRVFGSWGRYEDVSEGSAPMITRRGAGAQIKGDLKSIGKNEIEPFYNAVYWYYDYDVPQSNKSDNQQILDTVIGARWKTGQFRMETAYLRRWSWGDSPMHWDAYDPREELYQSAVVKLGTGHADEFWELGLRAAYSLDENELAEMAYRVGYEMDCTRWELVYRDDLQGDDNWIGLKLTIKAYPDAGVRLSGEELFEPSTAPDKLVPTSLKNN